MNYLAFAASHRKESLNAQLLKIAVTQAEMMGAHVITLDYGALNAPLFDADTYHHSSRPTAVEAFVKQMEDVDGVIIASPEYNWSFPGSLKNIIDWASVCTPNPLRGKTALLVSASPSMRGGMQGLIQLRVPLDHLGMFVYPQFFALGRAENAFSENGALTDEALAREYSGLIKSFVQFTATVTKKDTHA